MNVTPVVSATICATLRFAGAFGTPGGGGGGDDAGLPLNAAVTVVVALTVTTQAAVPLQAPLQPVNTEPALAVAVSVTRVPTTTVSLQSVPPATPPGELVTVPDPEPLLVTESVAVAPGAPEPLTPREAESLPTVEVTLPAKLPETVGRKRTGTVCEHAG